MKIVKNATGVIEIRNSDTNALEKFFDPTGMIVNDHPRLGDCICVSKTPNEQDEQESINIKLSEVSHVGGVAFTGTTRAELKEALVLLFKKGGSTGEGVQVAPIGATLMKTGQTTSYRTGDDGDLEVGRGVDFFTLANNNPFGNNKRFTGITGGYQIGEVNYNASGGTTTAALAFPHDIVIDWSTYNNTNVLGYYRILSSDVVWNTAIDNSLAFSIGPYTSAWRLPNSAEMISLMYILLTQAHSYNYNPFNFTWTGYFWTGTNSSTTAMGIYPFQHAIATLSKSQGASKYIPVRTFTVVGTTLT